MTEPSVLLRFSEDRVTEAERALAGSAGDHVETLTPSQVIRALRDRSPVLSRPRRLGVYGDPPESGIGYFVAPLVALASRPGSVLSIDASTGGAVRRPLARYLAGAAPGLVAQLAVSGAAVAAQRALAELLAARGAVDPGVRRAPAAVCYIRPMVGVPTSVGGSITHSHGVIRGMKAIGLTVDPVTTDPSIVETAAADPDPPCAWRMASVPRHFKAIPASLGMGGDLAMLRAAMASARTADFIYQRHARFSLVGGLLAHLTGTPLVLEYNGSEAFFEGAYDSTPLASQLALCEDAILAASTLVVVTSEVDERALVERGVPAERIVTSPNGVDAERFAQGGGESVRADLGIAADEVVVGFVGSYGPWHGTLALADAFAQVVRDRPEARLLLVGDGPEHSAVVARLAESGAIERTVVAGKVRPSEVARHLDACDLLVSPHVPMPGGVEFFGSPTKLFEYMAAGKGIVASRLGQIGTVLEDGRSARLVEPADVDELAAGIVELIDSPELRERFGAAARRDAIERHSWRANVERLVDAWAATTPRLPGSPARA
jgi:glycosyltransferase involved in cell wall biosynthesis